MLLDVRFLLLRTGLLDHRITLEMQLLLLRTSPLEASFETGNKGGRRVLHGVFPMAHQARFLRKFNLGVGVSEELVDADHNRDAELVGRSLPRSMH